MDEKTLVAGLLVLLLAALGFFGYAVYDARQQARQLQARGAELRAKAAAEAPGDSSGVRRTEILDHEQMTLFTTVSLVRFHGHTYVVWMNRDSFVLHDPDCEKCAVAHGTVQREGPDGGNH